MLGGEPKQNSGYVAAGRARGRAVRGIAREPMTREQFKRALEKRQSKTAFIKFASKPATPCFCQPDDFMRLAPAICWSRSSKIATPHHRVFDWNRSGNFGTPRQLHVDEALQSIDFNDAAPNLVESRGELRAKRRSLRDSKMESQRAREIASRGQFAIVFCLTGGIRCADIDLVPGDFLVGSGPVARSTSEADKSEQTSLLRVTFVGGARPRRAPVVLVSIAAQAATPSNAQTLLPPAIGAVTPVFPIDRTFRGFRFARDDKHSSRADGQANNNDCNLGGEAHAESVGAGARLSRRRY